MKKWKRFLSVLLCIGVVITMMPILSAQLSAAEAWLWPAADCLIISSNFGWRSWTDDYGYHEGNHGGIDIIGANGTAGKPVRATKSGEIYDGCNTIADNTYIAGSCGNYTCIDHGDGTFSIYMHMKPGNRISGTVQQGETIGYIGNTGESGGYHLHFELYTEKWNRQGSRLNPMPTNPEITIYNDYVLPSGWPSDKKTYVFEPGVPLTPKMWFENVKMTDTIVSGHSYVPECTICSNNGVKWYALVVLDSSNNKVRCETEDVWRVSSAYSYPITNAAQRLDLASLAEGNYSYSIQCMDNDDNYYTIYDKSFTVSKPSMWFENVNMTSFILQGTGYPLECTVCGNNGVKWYALVIYDSNNNVVQNESEAVWEHASIDTNSYPITNMLRFAELPVGNYRLSIQCMDNDNNYFTIYEKDFAVGAPDMWCENINLPDEIPVGHSFSLSGNILGNNIVKWYAIVIYDSASNVLQNKQEAVWKITDTYTYPITAVAEQLDFSVLPVGNYKLSIQSMDNDDNYFHAFEKDFSVSAPRMWCENINMPDELDYGQSFSLRGDICSNNLAKWYAIVIYDSNNTVLQNKSEAVWRVMDTNTYPITNVADQLDFSVLSSGRYLLSIQSMDQDDNYYHAYEKEFIIKCNQHTYTEVVTEPTCTEQGYTTYTCLNCGDSYVGNYVDALGHNYSYSVTTEPTTTVNGALTGICSRCSDTTTVTLPNLNTTDYSFEEVTAASCTENGTGRYTWKTTTYGTFTFDVPIPKTGHDYVETVTEPTCTEQGYTTHTCSRCGDNYKDTYVDALGHDFGAWTQIIVPTCTEKGEEKRTCSRCNAFETREIDALGHDLIHHPAQAPTCTAIGWDTYDTCSRCDFTTYVEKAALGHDYQAVVTAPTCTAGGYTTYTCSRCSDSYVADEVAALGHSPGASVEENRVNPTCTTNGGFDIVTYCSVCGVELTRVHTDLTALGHIWDDGVINPAASCTSDGVKTFTCLRCSETRTEAIAATGHTPGESAKENEVAATCTTAGGYDMVIRCTVCNAILNTEHFEIAALGHDYQAVVTAPTCTEGGYTTYTCSRCGDSYVADETAALGHTPGEPVKENDLSPTCEAAGGYDMVVYCTVCGTEINCEHADVAALGHDWSEPTYEWAEDYSTVTATRTCQNDASHAETETVNTTSEVTKEATYDEEGEITYTAVFENTAFTTQTKTVATPKLDGPKPYEPCDGGDDCPGNMFTDMPPKGNWAHDAIDWAIVNKITAGTSATTFSPNAGCTRAQVVTFLWRAAGEPEPETTNNPFEDVKEGTWYSKAVLWAVETGVTAGTSATTFSPDATCTRAQIVTFLWRFEGEPAYTMTNNPFTDVKAGAYFEKAVLWASETGVTAGTSATTFSPDATCTRAQVVTFLYRDIEN